MLGGPVFLDHVKVIWGQIDYEMGRRKQRTVFGTKKKKKEIFTASEINRLNSKAKRKSILKVTLEIKHHERAEVWAREKGMSSEEWERPGQVLGRAGADWARSEAPPPTPALTAVTRVDEA